jgi:small subunit ribosomal protein S18
MADKAQKEKKDDKLADVFDESSITEDEDEEESGKSGKRRSRRKRSYSVDLSCPLCEASVKVITYKDVYQLKKYTSVRGKIIGREKSGMCATHQRQLSRAIKKARYVALLPYVSMSK